MTENEFKDSEISRKRLAVIKQLKGRVAELRYALEQMDMYCGCHNCSACQEMARVLAVKDDDVNVWDL